MHVDFGIVTLISKTTCCLRLVLLHQGVVLKGSFYCTSGCHNVISKTWPRIYQLKTQHSRLLNLPFHLILEDLQAAGLRKSNKQSYLQLVSDLEVKGYTFNYRTLEIGSVGHYEQCALNCIERVFNLPKHCCKKLLLNLSKTVALIIHLTQGTQDHGIQISLSAPHSPLSEGHQYIT